VGHVPPTKPCGACFPSLTLRGIFPLPNPAGHVIPSLTLRGMFRLPNPEGYVSPSLTSRVREGETHIVGELSIRRTVIKWIPSLDWCQDFLNSLDCKKSLRNHRVLIICSDYRHKKTAMMLIMQQHWISLNCTRLLLLWNDKIKFQLMEDKLKRWPS